MIGFISGRVKWHHGGEAVVMAGGVGYRVRLPERTRLSKMAQLYIHTQVREDAINLFGFATSDELEMFEQLIGVSGVGPAKALSLLSKETVDGLKAGIVQGRVEVFTAVAGIGKKNAQRLIIELRGKLGGKDEGVEFAEANKEVAEALSGLGFARQEIRQALKGLPEGISEAQTIKAALKKLNRP